MNPTASGIDISTATEPLVFISYVNILHHILQSSFWHINTCMLAFFCILNIAFVLFRLNFLSLNRIKPFVLHHCANMFMRYFPVLALGSLCLWDFLFILYILWEIVRLARRGPVCELHVVLEIVQVEVEQAEQEHVEKEPRWISRRERRRRELKKNRPWLRMSLAGARSRDGRVLKSAPSLDGS